MLQGLRLWFQDESVHLRSDKITAPVTDAAGQSRGLLLRAGQLFGHLFRARV